MRNRLYRALRSSESLFKTDMVYLAKGGFWLTAGQTGSMIASFFLSIAFANLLSQYEYGTYRYILSTIGIISVFSLSGLGSALTRSLAKGYESSVWRAFWINFKWSILITLGAGFLGLYYLSQDNSTLGASLLIAGALTPFLDSGELYTAVLNGTQRFKQASLFRVGRSIFVSAGIFLSLLLSDELLPVIITYFTLQTVSSMWCFFIISKGFPRGGDTDPDLIKIGKHTSVMNSLSVFIDKIDSILVFQLLGPIQLAIYNFALIIPNNLSGLIKNLGVLAVPKFAMADKRILKKELIRKSLRVFVASLALLVLYATFAPYIFDLLFPHYRESVVYSQIYAASILFSGALPLAYLDSQVAIRIKYVQTVVSNAFKLIAIVAGFYYFGLWGLILGRIASKIFGIALVFFLIKIND